MIAEVQKHGRRLDGMTTYQYVEDIIKRATADSGESVLEEIKRQQGSGVVGKAEIFV
eukprot:CAMPEP_0181313136 /NCGR_PEP_ID=MMETSP1101-20121128/14087_1 /TAXON_ID=46948 /ORGANISM="Rhodomonas abbreviata, Strain Caron Lab Isolate" /LENGTH=56 /DNA_ID=CAMNT_0023420069 /DNA_START=121 /DNA_END=287 /DNA_ORIENTATION=-